MVYQKSDPKSIQALFSTIASNYDRTNNTCSFGLHKIWNRHLVHSVKGSEYLLDLCSGTGEIAFGFLKNNTNAQAILLDFCPEMLAVAQKKGSSLFVDRFKTVVADATDIPLKSDCVDAVTIAYGIRNIKDPAICFKEVLRVLRHQGSFCILELTRPSSRLLNVCHQWYTRCALPFLGKISTRNKDAYQYLARSVQTFSSPEEWVILLEKTGFRVNQCLPLMGGVATLLIAHNDR